VRNVVLTFKVSEEEAAQIRADAGPRKVSAHIRACVLGTAPRKPARQEITAVPGRFLPSPLKDDGVVVLPDNWDQLVAKHKLRMSTPAAERMARKELGT
jgi:hypothetical protein